MCGIVGQINTRGPVDTALFEKMLETLAHRGPDGTGIESLAGGAVALGHRRLAIIDLSNAAKQPMPNEDGAVWLVANGEIFNYRGLRRDLQAAGHTFRSYSDSEVIIHAYEEWGVSFVRKLRGMFAVALWDERRQRLLLARDRLGVKPLYYRNHPGGFVFASQPRAILADPSFARSIDNQALHAFFACRYVPGDMAIYAGMEKLPAAHLLVWEDSSYRVERYWKLEYRPEITKAEEAIELIREKIEEAVRVELVSDVEVGVYLSGGIDSSTIGAVATRSLGKSIPTFTLGFDVPESDERRYARIAAEFLGAKAHEGELDLKSAIDLIPTTVGVFDEPTFEPSGLPSYAVSRIAQEFGVKVLLSGEGGDELFAGYRWYDQLTQNQQISLLQRALGWIRSSRPPFLPRDPVAAYFSLNGVLDSRTQSLILSDPKPFDHLGPFRNEFDTRVPRVTGYQLLDIHTFLVDSLLVKLDHASMACGIEARVPLLDYRLVEAAFTIDSDVIYSSGERKAIMKQSVADWLPPKILTARKKGFSLPLFEWMNRGLFELAEKFVVDGSLVGRGVFKPDGVRSLLALRQSQATWAMLTSELWARRWLDDEDLEASFSKIPRATFEDRPKQTIMPTR